MVSFFGTVQAEFALNDFGAIAERRTRYGEPQARADRCRKQLAALENAVTAGHPHFGHLPVHVQEIEGWIFRRCRCGFTLALTPSGTILWLKITKPAVEIKNFKLLLRALNSNCVVHPRPGPLKVAVTPVQPSAVAGVQTTGVGTKIVEPLVSKEATDTPPQPVSRTQNDAKPTNKQLMPGMPEAEKPPPMKERVDKSPIKQRRVYSRDYSGKNSGTAKAVWPVNR